MRFNIDTGTLKAMAAKAAKAATDNRLIPLTSVMRMSVSDSTLSLTTTDGSNFMHVSERAIADGCEFDVCIMAKLFCGLIAKTTSESVTVELSGKALIVTGNGQNKLEILIDDDGDPLKFPMFEFDYGKQKRAVDPDELKGVVRINRHSLGKDYSRMELTGYYFDGRGTISSNRYMACYSQNSIFDCALLLPPSLIDLACALGGRDYGVQVDGENVMFSSSAGEVFGALMREKYPVDVMRRLFDNTCYDYDCKVNRAELIAALDRLALFASAMEAGVIKMEFRQDGLHLLCQSNNARECLKYESVYAGFIDYECLVDGGYLRGQLAAQDGEFADIWYGGQTKLIKLNAGNGVTQVIALFVPITKAVGKDEVS